MITYMPFHLGLLTILATCGVEANAIARDRSMTDRSYQGDIAEILIYNTVLDTPTVKKIQTILGTKYGLPDLQHQHHRPLFPACGQPFRRCPLFMQTELR